MNDKNKAIDVEVEGENTSKTAEEQNSGGFKGWFNKTKSNVKSQLLENKIESAFEETNTKFDLGSYKKDALIATQRAIYGYFNEAGNLVVYNAKGDIAPYSIIISSKDDKAYFIVKKLNEVPVEITLDGVKYVRSANEYLVNEHVQEVKVIKVNSRYFVYENPNEK